MTHDRGAADASAGAPDGDEQSLEDDAVDAVADELAPETGLLGGLDPGWVASSLAPVAVASPGRGSRRHRSCPATRPMSPRSGPQGPGREVTRTRPRAQALIPATGGSAIPRGARTRTSACSGRGTCGGPG